MCTYCAVMPPSMTSSEPVTQDDSSDGRTIGDITRVTEPTHRRAIEQHLARGWVAETLLG
jgi:hypothetical protein